ncbi:hypothetical protein NIES2101_09570 [Calothrix sp. HK-06]|nr:hypothetical protein NIES2101_09570 [Calothrix sp. HK-06]
MKTLKYVNAALAALIMLTTSVSITTAQPPDSIKQQVKSEVVAPQKITDAVMRNARSNWGLGKNSGKIINTKRAKWSPDCGNIPLALCDVAVFTGWNVTIADGNKYWDYFVSDSVDQVILIGRDPQNRTNVSVPKPVMDNILNMASKHLELSKNVLLIKQVQRKTWTNICLEFALPYARCRTDDNQLGWRVVIEGKPGKEYVYLASEKGEQARTEATKTLATRNDLMPNSWATNIAKTASKRFKIPSNRVYLLSAEQQYNQNQGNYFWNVAVDVKQNAFVTYELDTSGNITKQP